MNVKWLKALFFILSTILFWGCGQSEEADRANARRHMEAREEDDDDRPGSRRNSTSDEREHSPEFIINYDIEIPDEYCFDNVSAIVDMVAEMDPDKNIIISDTSLNMALGLLAEGAEGSTLDALEQYLAGSGYEADIDYIRDRNNALINIYDEMDDVTIHIADNVYADDDVELLNDYINQLRCYYDADAITLDFQDSGSAEIINAWCSDMTEGKIDRIISSDVLAISRAVLINALYFNGDWDEPFKEHNIETENFTNADGSTSEVSMMYAYDTGAYFENEYAVAFSKYYEGFDIAFIGILPKEEGEFTFEELDLNSLLASETYSYQVNIKMPAFKLEDENSLSSILYSLGLGIVFDDGDFSGITDRDLNVSEVIQKTYIDVNEKGTEAAAVTAVVLNDACAIDEYVPEIREVYLDRPFAFLIYDMTNKECLFAGKINELKN